MIKLIATDIDGTLLPEGTDKINPEIFETVLKLKEKGIVFAAASGRHYKSISHLFEPIKNEMIFIAENGSYVNCRGTDMLEVIMKREYIEELIHMIREIPEACITIDSKEGFYIEDTDSVFVDLLTNGYHNQVFRVPDLLDVPGDFYKLAMYKAHGIREIAEELMPKWSDRIHCTVSGDIWLDFMDKGVNKGNAIRSIQKALGIAPEETMVFGDNYNDIEMMQSAVESYAVGNARDAVKKIAKYVTDTNVNDGVLKVLRTLL